MVGQKVKLLPFQRKLIRDIYDDPNTRQAIITFGRKNGKTALAAMLLLVHLVGPMHQRNSQLYSSALSRDQAALLFDLAKKMVQFSPILSELINVKESQKSLECARYGTTYTALSADFKTNFGLSPCFLVHDELGAVRGPRHDLYDTLESAFGAQENPLSIIISTQAATDNDLLSILIDDAKTGADPTIKLFMYTADEDADPFDVETIKQANPAFGVFQNPKVSLDYAAKAERMPTAEAKYRNLILNQRIEADAPFMPRSIWAANGDPPGDFGTVYGGLDLSQTSDLTAFVLVSPVKGLLHVRPTFWLPGKDLADRSRTDRVPYDIWEKQGHLETCEGRSVRYEFVAAYIIEAFEKYNIRKIAFDAWGMVHLKSYLLTQGMSETFFDEHFEPFRQGWESMGPAVDRLEEVCLAEEMRHGMHPVLTMCAANARAEENPAGKRKLSKIRSTGRIDGMVALAMATYLAHKDLHAKPVFSRKFNEISRDFGSRGARA